MYVPPPGTCLAPQQQLVSSRHGSFMCFCASSLAGRCLVKNQYLQLIRKRAEFVNRGEIPRYLVVQGVFLVQVNSRCGEILCSRYKAHQGWFRFSRGVALCILNSTGCCVKHSSIPAYFLFPKKTRQYTESNYSAQEI